MSRLFLIGAQTYKEKALCYSFPCFTHLFGLFFCTMSALDGISLPFPPPPPMVYPVLPLFVTVTHCGASRTAGGFPQCCFV
ncbi:hypothetical protein XELAEV_18010256mg [Xenopus laevis]|uniref:Uncharacterized protein n=1 Tax=Xenopus laevis TaxID=8355 RepID=A0A974I155_XENLA|nr:hypothetical protein XELAEV_18010256mg [Xenopus laevis]